MLKDQVSEFWEHVGETKSHFPFSKMLHSFHKFPNWEKSVPNLLLHLRGGDRTWEWDFTCRDRFVSYTQELSDLTLLSEDLNFFFFVTSRIGPHLIFKSRVDILGLQHWETELLTW